MRNTGITTNNLTRSTESNRSNQVARTPAKEAFKNVANVFLEMHIHNSIEITQICLKVIQNKSYSEIHNIPQAFIDSLINLCNASGININGISPYFTKFLAIPYIVQAQEKAFNANGNFNFQNFREWLSKEEFTSIMPDIINKLPQEDLSGLIKNRWNTIQFWNNGEDGIYAIDLAKLIKSPPDLTINNTKKRKFDEIQSLRPSTSQPICFGDTNGPLFNDASIRLNQSNREQRFLILTQLNRWADSQHQATPTEINTVKLKIIQACDNTDITSIVISENVSIPQEILALLPNITNLTLHGNVRLLEEDFPPYFTRNLMHIRELSLFNNTDNPPQADALPKNLFRNLPNLTTLNINVCGIVNEFTLPELIYLYKLENLHLKIANQSHIENIFNTNKFPHDIIGCFPNLKNLELENFTIDDIHKTIFQNLPCKDKLQKLTLKNSDPLKIEAAAFSSCSALTHLTIEGFKERKLFQNTNIFTGLANLKKITIDNYNEIKDDVEDSEEEVEDSQKEVDDWQLTPNLDGLKEFLRSNPNVEWECPYLDEKSLAQIAASQPNNA
ncbi:MAG: hypothetical protein KBD37_04165 [Burkholderiales bacterium]|nr:hypothetical protein [Burkholderiales bacterium]